MPELNESQKGNLLITLQHVNELLCDCEGILASAESPSFFQKYVADTDPRQRECMEDLIGQFREMMCRVLQDQGIQSVRHPQSAKRSALNSLLFADMAIEEMQSKHMKGFGKLSAAAAMELDAIVADMRRLIDRMSKCLMEKMSAHLHVR